MSWGRQQRVIAVSLATLSAVALTSVWVITRLTGTKWPAGSDEDRLARAMQQYDRWSRNDPITQLMKRFDLITPEFEWVHDVAQEIFDRDGARAIPLLIGVIEADNSSSTLGCIGYHMLGNLANVEQNMFHDGAWWRRWWEAHKHKYPADVPRNPDPPVRQIGPRPAAQTVSGRYRHAASQAAVRARAGGGVEEVPSLRPRRASARSGHWRVCRRPPIERRSPRDSVLDRPDRRAADE